VTKAESGADELRYDRERFVVFASADAFSELDKANVIPYALKDAEMDWFVLYFGEAAGEGSVEAVEYPPYLALTMVPTPSSVKISSSKTWGSRPSRI
jgi:hypothetical protein